MILNPLLFHSIRIIIWTMTKTMMKKFFLRLTPVTIAFAVVFAAGCAGTKTQSDLDIPTGPSITEDQLGNSDQGRALGLQTVNFPFDSFALDEQGKAILRANAEILKEKASVKIQIEGHCDQRGGIQYNIALGEKRANATKNYLVDLGVQADRISTISFGKENPLDSAETEEAYAKNRRANFVIVAQ